MSSRRGYLTHEELEEYAEISIIDGDEADDQISQAEEMIDDYVGFQEKFASEAINGQVSAVPTTTTFTLQADKITAYNAIDYFKNMHVEVIGGAGSGQTRKITGSNESGVLTVESVWGTPIDTTSIYKIYQLGKFPRSKDVYSDTRVTPTKYYKSIVDDVKRAIAAQVQYMIEMGEAFFASNGETVSTTIGDFSETKKSGGGVKTLIAPKARHMLRGIMNRTGRLVA